MLTHYRAPLRAERSPLSTRSASEDRRTQRADRGDEREGEIMNRVGRTADEDDERQTRIQALRAERGLRTEYCRKKKRSRSRE